MVQLSEESKLLVKNWDTVQAIINAEKQLRKELGSLLYSLEKKLTNFDWWKKGWVFERMGDSQVYISHRNWEYQDEDLIWIGVENFIPQALFGIETSPSLYIWVPAGQHKLAKMLHAIIEKDKDDIIGELDSRTSGYVVKHAVRKILPDEIEQFDEIVCKQILEFFSFYTKYFEDFDKVVNDFLSTT